MSHQDESVMRALSTETNTDNGTSCAMCRQGDAQRKKNEYSCSHEASSPQVLTCELGVDSSHYLNLGNFLSDHQLLHSWDFHDVLCRLGNRIN